MAWGWSSAHGDALDVRRPPPERDRHPYHSEAKMLIFENDFVPLVEHIRKACPAIRYVTIDQAGPLADLTYEELLSRGRIDRPDVFSFDENAIAELFYTSGSTGTPKGVTLSHRTLYLHALAVAGTFNHDDTAVELHTIPLFHANGWGLAGFHDDGSETGDGAGVRAHRRLSFDSG